MSQICDILREWKKECEYKGVIQFKHSYSTGILTIFTAYPGYLIGKEGCHAYKYIEIFKNKIIGFDTIKFVETDHRCIV